MSYILLTVNIIIVLIVVVNLIMVRNQQGRLAQLATSLQSKFTEMKDEQQKQY